MNAVTMVKQCDLDKNLCMNELTYLMFLNQKKTIFLKKARVVVAS